MIVFEARARRAVDGIRRSVELMPARLPSAPDTFERYVRFERRRTRNERIQVIVLVLVLAALAIGGIAEVLRQADPRPADQPVIYLEWSDYGTSTTPVGSRVFLGEFGNQTVSLSLANLPAHAEVTLECDLLILKSWDGNFRKFGPDVFDLSIGDGETLLHTTFASPGTGLHQAYPDAYPGGGHPGGMGATEVKTLGYEYFGDSVYHLRFTFPHADTSLRFDFSASLSEKEVQDESWGLDNVVVAVDGTPIYTLNEPAQR